VTVTPPTMQLLSFGFVDDDALSFPIFLLKNPWEGNPSPYPYDCFFVGMTTVDIKVGRGRILSLAAVAATASAAIPVVVLCLVVALQGIRKTRVVIILATCRYYHSSTSYVLLLLIWHCASTGAVAVSNNDASRFCGRVYSYRTPRFPPVTRFLLLSSSFLF